MKDIYKAVFEPISDEEMMELSNWLKWKDVWTDIMTILAEANLSTSGYRNLFFECFEGKQVKGDYYLACRRK